MKTFGEMVKYLLGQQEESNYDIVINSKEKKIIIQYKSNMGYKTPEDNLGNLTKRQIEIR